MVRVIRRDTNDFLETKTFAEADTITEMNGTLLVKQGSRTAAIFNRWEYAVVGEETDA